MPSKYLNSIRDAILFPNRLSDRDRTGTHSFIADSLLERIGQPLH
jgi:hypothetical protein